MTQQHLSLIQDCVAKGDMLPFYKQAAWKEKRREVLTLDHNECQHCRKRGMHTKAKAVHHVNHVKDKPELALSVWYTDANGERKRNLVALCHACHERAHEYRVKESKPAPWPERW